MALILRHLDCHTCGTRHNFGIDADGWDTNTLYEYVCPQTGTRSAMSLPPTATAEQSAHWLQGAIQLYPVGAAAQMT